MSKQNSKNGNLPKLQKKIVLCLASSRNGPLTMSEINREINGSIASTTRACHALEARGMLVKTADSYSYRGRDFDKYGPSFRACAFALINGAKPELVRLNALKSSTKTEDKEALDEYFILRSSGPTVANVLDQWMLSVGKIEPRTLLLKVIPSMLSMDQVERNRLIDAAKQSPYWKHTENTLEKMMNLMRKVLSHD